MPVLLALAIGGAVLAVAYQLRPGGILAPSEHFTLAELTTTRQTIPNIPTPAALVNLSRLATEALEPLREEFGPLRITSGYRSAAVNAAVGGSATSEHMTGLAADLVPVTFPGGGTAMYAQIKARGLHRSLGLDQVIYYTEQKHLHIGLRSGEGRGMIGVQPEVREPDGNGGTRIRKAGPVQWSA